MVSLDLSNGNIFAYIGDSVITLKTREYLVGLGYTKSKDLQEKSKAFVSAKAQAKIITALLAKDFFTEKEIEIYKLGRNYKGHSIAKNVDVQTYKMASGLEAIFGYWHLNNNPQRLIEIWNETLAIVKEDL